MLSQPPQPVRDPSSTSRASRNGLPAAVDQTAAVFFLYDPPVNQLRVTTNGRNQWRLAWIAMLVFIGPISVACRESGPSDPVDNDEQSMAASSNIILILSDTHRLDHVSGFSDTKMELTPNIAALIRDGVAFTNVYTPVPISAPAYASLMTGLRPVDHGVLNNQQKLGPEPTLLQERLGLWGYRTAAVVGNPFCSSEHGFGRGFDFFWDKVDGRGKEGGIITDEAIRWLETSTEDSPFFLFVAYMDAHTPYITDEIPPSLRVELNGAWIRDERAENAHIEQRYELEFRPGANQVTLSFLSDGGPALPADAASPLHIKDMRMASGLRLERTNSVVPIEGTPYERLNNTATLTVTNGEDRPVTDELIFRCYRKYRPEVIPDSYAAGVRSFDRSVGRLIEDLRRRGLYDDAIVIFVSDHGEMLGEHDAWGHVPHLYQETMQVPLVIKAPGLKPGSKDTTLLDLLDLHDIVLDVASHWGAEFGDVISTAEDRTLVGATYPPEAGVLQASATRGSLKVIVTSDGEARAFDLSSDPKETTDILGRMNEDHRIQDLLAAAHSELAAAATAESLDLSALSVEERDRLRALGYLDSDP